MPTIHDMLPAGAWDKPRTRGLLLASLDAAYRQAHGMDNPEITAVWCDDRAHMRKPHYHITVTGEDPPPPAKTAARKGASL
jgi:hypothetical protein